MLVEVIDPAAAGPRERIIAEYVVQIWDVQPCPVA
jgi:hypothetical protein